MRLPAFFLFSTMQSSIGRRSSDLGMRDDRQIHSVFSIARVEKVPERRTLASSTEFVSDCTSYLLSTESIKDGIVSQDEFASFLFSRCPKELCNGDGMVEFEWISLNLQLSFVRGVCPFKNIEDRINCIEDLENMWLVDGVFGYDVSDGIDKLEVLIKDMCENAFGYVIEMGPTISFAPTPYATSLVNEPDSVPQYTTSIVPSHHRSTISPTLAPSIDTLDSALIPEITTRRPSSYVGSPSDNDSPTMWPNPFHPPNSFTTECKAVLLSPAFLEDNIVSQIEFTSFLMDRCRAEGMCDKRSKVSFEQLNPQLQLDFILGACQDDIVECIGVLEASWRNGTHFGFNAEDEGIENSVDMLCSKAFDSAISMGLVNTREPSSSDPTMAPTAAMPNVTPQLDISAPSVSPSTSESNRLPPTEKKPLRSRRSLVGASIVLAFLLFTAGGVLAYKRNSDSTVKKNVPSEYYSKEPYHNGLSAYAVHWMGAPFALSIASSCSSSSSSFRDHRFVPVFGPNGESIVQFNPNTAAAVVIGSVTIGGGGSSSISTGPRPFLASKESTSKAYIMVGQVSQEERARSEAYCGNSSELSSMSSEQSPTVMSSASFRSHGFHPYHTSKEVHGLASESVNMSENSRWTMPMATSKCSKFERHALNFQHESSFSDWVAATNLISDNREPSHVTDSSAAFRQKQFFFDLFTSTQQSDGHASVNSSGTRRQCQSTNGIIMIPLESNEKVEGERHLPRETPAEEVLIPWRKGGFSPAFQPSDGKQSSESTYSSHSVYMERHWGTGSVIVPRQNLPLQPLWSAVKHMRRVTRNFFKRKQYQHLNERLREDQSVISMKSYSSDIQLLPSPSNAPVFGLPGLLLGTWAAATIPLESEVPRTQNIGDIDAYADVASHYILPEEFHHGQDLSSGLKHQSQPVTLGIASNSDNISPSTGWVSPSARCSFISSSRSTSWNPSAVSTNNNTRVNEESFFDRSTIRAVNYPHSIVEGSSVKEPEVDSQGKQIKFINPNDSNIKAHHSVDAKVVSDSSGSFRSVEGLSNQTSNERELEQLHSNRLYFPYSQTHDQNLAMMFSRHIDADTGNEDWSNVSDSTTTSESASESVGGNAHSLSLSIKSEADNASLAALDWAITREISKVSISEE